MTTRGRPFAPGVSGNPGGRAKGIERQLREMFAEDLPKIAVAMRDIALSASEKAADRIKAAEWIYDRCYGKPKQSLDLVGELALGASGAAVDLGALPLDKRRALVEGLRELRELTAVTEPEDDGSTS